jgi:hypothetical protein
MTKAIRHIAFLASIIIAIALFLFCLGAPLPAIIFTAIVGTYSATTGLLSAIES